MSTERSKDSLGARLPHFDAEEKVGLLGAMGKLTRDRWSFLGLAQRVSHPTYGAEPLGAPETTVDATETFQVAQLSLDAASFDLRFGFSRGDLDSRYGGDGAPVRDLATGEAFEAPLLVTNRTRTRWSALARRDFVFDRHVLRGGVEVSHADESGRERVPGSRTGLLVDGVDPCGLVLLGRRSTGHERDALRAVPSGRVLRRPISDLSGVRVDRSGSGPVQWTSLSGSIGLGYALTPSSEIHFSLGRYPHVLTTRLAGVEQGLSWTWRRWDDGLVLRRGGSAYTSIEEDLPRPYTDELTIGVEKHFRRGFLRFSGYQRWEKRLLQTVNVGIAPSSYETFFFHDVGVDGDLGTEDDRDIPIYDQRRQLGEDLFVLTHPPRPRKLRAGSRSPPRLRPRPRLLAAFGPGLSRRGVGKRRKRAG